MEGKRRMSHCHETSEIKKGPWKAEEDEVLINHVKKYGPRDWSSIRSKGLLRRTGKSCRLRWVNKLRPNLKNGVKFSAEEERTVIELQAQFGNKWAKIATYLSGRTDNDVKNFWSSRQKRLARTLQITAPSSSNSQNTEEVKVPAFHEVTNFVSSTEEELVTKPKSCSSSHINGDSQAIQMVLPELIHPSMHSYEHSLFRFDYTPQNKPYIDPNSHLYFPSIPQIQRDFTLQLESQELITELGDPNFLDVFGDSSESALGSTTAQLSIVPSCFPDTCCQIAVKADSRETRTPDIFMDDFPPIDMFGPIEQLPSPSDWSSMD